MITELNGGKVVIYQGDCRDVLTQLPDESVQTVVTSPPYYGLRDYQVDGQIGLEQTPDEYVASMVEVFREVRRVLREDGTLWLNMGDSYCGSPRGNKNGWEGSGLHGVESAKYQETLNAGTAKTMDKTKIPGLKPKDLIGIPWRLALALQADGWWLRQDIIWHKPNPMPESVTDRCTKAHEYIFLMTKAARYYYDAEAIKEPAKWERWGNQTEKKDHTGTAGHLGGKTLDQLPIKDKKNKRSVWSVNTTGFPGAHFAVFPPKLIEPCILAGTSAEGACAECGSPRERVVERRDRGHDGSRYGERIVAANVSSGGSEKSTLGSSGGELVGYNETTGWQPTCKCKAVKPVPCTVLDPFMGSGTTGEVAINHSCKFIGIELNEDYIKLAVNRLKQSTLF